MRKINEYTTVSVDGVFAGPRAKPCPSSGVAWTCSASHELLEMLEDPTGHTWPSAAQRGICDLVETTPTIRTSSANAREPDVVENSVGTLARALFRG